ncbi:hypothetical protein [Lichenifustis flavocetrariae]|uniref:Uncharacterized protein n=1 Tax=Lichenifustis flavocetrariae TaxID=2949735 RepID=A0AA41Z3Z4_9HYPH|nr:hypothetical protein [Lichenifustis flavocetrariae]MCW6509910.1 hypothetical protein [Lichenifustis flavocetrariae]
MVDDLSLILKTYTRTFLTQSVGIIGLIWCLAQNQAAFACVLAVLVLTDQGLFLRARFASETRGFPLRTFLNIWCLAVSAMDVLILFAAIFRSAGLHQVADGKPVADALSCLAYAIAAFAHADVGVAASSGAGRLAAAVEALLGDAVLMGGITGIALHVWRIADAVSPH